MAMRRAHTLACWRTGWVLAAVLLAGCSSSPSAVSPSPTPASSGSPTVGSPVNEPGSTTFTSNLYGYSLTLPSGWEVTPATIPWDGISDPGHLEPTVDQMGGHSVAVAWAFSTRVTEDLKAYASERMAADATAHPCPKTPSTTTEITIDGQPGLLMARDCGILVLTALTIHNSTGFLVYLQDSSVHGATDATDEQILANMLASMRLPK